MERREYTEEEQALIDGVEFGLDYRLELAEEDVEAYHRLTGSRCMGRQEGEKKE